MAKFKEKGGDFMTILQAILYGIAGICVICLGLGWLELCDRLGW